MWISITYSNNLASEHNLAINPNIARVLNTEINYAKISGNFGYSIFYFLPSIFIL